MPKRSQKLEAEDRQQLVIPIIILLVVIVLDQITKIWAVSALSEGSIYQLLGQLIQFKLVYNIGGALGTNLGNSYFYLISSILILLVVLYFVYNYRRFKMIAYPMAAIAGGAIGNIADRLRIGKVIDFIDIDFFDIKVFGLNIERWWIFNIADAAITVGIILLLLFIIFHKKEEVESEKADNTGNPVSENS